MITKLYIVRHGLTGIVEKDQQPDQPLSDLGVSQIEKAALRLSAHTPIAAIYSSAYERAKQSAAIIAQKTGNPATSADSRLNELQIWNSPEELAHDSAIVPATLKTIATHATDTVTFFGEIISQHAGETVILVCHGNIIRAIVAKVLEAQTETIVRLEVDNASITLVEYDTNTSTPFYRLHTFNDTCHLSG